MNNNLLLSSYNFDLPKELIAQKPQDKRDESKLLILNRQKKSIEHRYFKDITDYLGKNDCLVMNNTKVVPARVFGKKETGGRVEVLFLSDSVDSKDEVLALVKPVLKSGVKILFPENITAFMGGESKNVQRVIKIDGEKLEYLLNNHGQMPLPPYIKRPKTNKNELIDFDKERYQTVYAKNLGSIAAPTAGLHFTDELMAKLKNNKVDILNITLHVGIGTFKPIVCENIKNHEMMEECYKIKKEYAKKIKMNKASGKRLIVVGTTATRALESVADEIKNEEKNDITGKTSLFIYPGYKFKIIDSLITNFHLPCSTPLMMACAFAGKELIFKAYQEAIKRKYRFFSYGDSMLIL